MRRDTDGTVNWIRSWAITTCHVSSSTYASCYHPCLTSYDTQVPKITQCKVILSQRNFFLGADDKCCIGYTSYLAIRSDHSEPIVSGQTWTSSISFIFFWQVPLIDWQPAFVRDLDFSPFKQEDEEQRKKIFCLQGSKKSPSHFFHLKWGKKRPRWEERMRRRTKRERIWG